MSPFDRVHTTSYSTLIETNHLSCAILSYSELFVSKVGNFNLHHLPLTPFEFRQDFWQQKTRVPGLLCGVCLHDF